jgi:aspartate racemase
VRTIGLLGGMAWPSSLVYYRLLNQEVERRLGGHHSARCVLLSVDFAAIERLQATGDWERAGSVLAEEARRLDAAGIDVLLLATNTMHRVAAPIAAATRARFVHIADALGDALAAAGLTRVGLLGTRYTMEGGFYAETLARRGIETLVPDPSDRQAVHDIIYRELVHDRVEPASRQVYLDVIARLADRGAQTVALACTEIMLLVGDGDAAVPLLDTTTLHCRLAVDLALGPQLDVDRDPA